MPIVINPNILLIEYHEFKTEYEVRQGLSPTQKYKGIYAHKLSLLRKFDTSVSDITIRKNEIICCQIAAQLEVGPNLLFKKSDFSEYIIEYVAGRNLNTEDIYDDSVFNKLILVLKKLHKERQFIMPIAKNTLQERIYKQYHFIKSHNLILPTIFKNIIQKVVNLSIYLNDPDDICNCHHDTTFSNFIIDDKKKITLIDWEFSGLCSRYIDLGIMVTLMNFTREQTDRLLELYLGRKPNSENTIKLEIVRLLQITFTCLLSFNKYYTLSHNNNLSKKPEIPHNLKDHHTLLNEYNHRRFLISNCDTSTAIMNWHIASWICLEELDLRLKTKRYDDMVSTMKKINYEKFIYPKHCSTLLSINAQLFKNVLPKTIEKNKELVKLCQLR